MKHCYALATEVLCAVNQLYCDEIYNRVVIKPTFGEEAMLVFCAYGVRFAIKALIYLEITNKHLTIFLATFEELGQILIYFQRN